MLIWSWVLAIYRTIELSSVAQQEERTGAFSYSWFYSTYFKCTDESVKIVVLYTFRISFDRNGFHTNPKHLVGHSYVIFERDRGGYMVCKYDVEMTY